MVLDYTYYEDGNLGLKNNLSTQSAIHNTQYYIYDGIHCIAKYDQDNNLINEIVYGPQIDEVLCSIDNSDTAHYYHQDALQSVTVITDGFANKSATYEYDVYGKIKDKTGTFKNEISYTGRWLDEDIEFYYYRARWYDADSGRFISRDPIGTAGGINLYGYVGGNPVNFSDPLGQFSWSLKRECETIKDCMKRCLRQSSVPFMGLGLDNFIGVVVGLQDVYAANALLNAAAQSSVNLHQNTDAIFFTGRKAFEQASLRLDKVMVNGMKMGRTALSGIAKGFLAAGVFDLARWGTCYAQCSK